MKRPKYFGALTLLFCAGSAALSGAGDDAKKHLKQADVCFNQRTFTCAVAESREAVRLAPDDPRAHLYLGDALYQNFDSDGALPEYKEAIRLKLDYPEAHMGWATRWTALVIQKEPSLSTEKPFG
jgi:cytochrome c-type biogenesis protein CcmH/NrfG